MFQIAKKELKVKTNDLFLDKDDQLLKKLINEDIKYDLILIDVY
jgi:hypothetical protein